MKRFSYSVLHYRVKKILALQSRMVSLLFPFLAPDPFHVFVMEHSFPFSTIPNFLPYVNVYVSFTHQLLNGTLDVLRESNLTWLDCSPFTTHFVQVLESLQHQLQIWYAFTELRKKWDFLELKNLAFLSNSSKKLSRNSFLMQEINFSQVNSVKKFVFTLWLPARTLSRFSTDNWGFHPSQRTAWQSLVWRSLKITAIILEYYLFLLKYYLGILDSKMFWGSISPSPP